VTTRGSGLHERFGARLSVRGEDRPSHISWLQLVASFADPDTYSSSCLGHSLQQSKLFERVLSLAPASVPA